MEKYKDIDFSFGMNPFTGDLNVIQDSNAIKQSLKNIILTLKGEKSFNYLFGAAAQNILFENSGDVSMTVLNDIDSSIRNNEPRIKLNKIYLDNSGTESKIVIDYEYSLDTGESVNETTTVTAN